jgi:hypothetical protein
MDQNFLPNITIENNIKWNKTDMSSMIKAQIELNNIIISREMTKNIKEKLSKLQTDLNEYGTSTCSVCNAKNKSHSLESLEHINIKFTWGYNSNYDGQHHILTLCCDCYTKHIMEGFLGTYVNIKEYM